MAAGLPIVDSAYKEAIKAASADIQELIKKEHCTPMLIRLAFHDALTYDAATNTSGANGSIRFVPLGEADKALRSSRSEEALGRSVTC